MSSEPVPLVGRYRFGRRIEAARNAVVWFAFDDQTGGQVVASLLAMPRASAFIKAVGVTDPHLAPVIQIIRELDPASLPAGVPYRGSCVVVAEHIAGEALYGTLKAGPTRRPEAVRCAMDLASALSALHRRGAVHGAFSPLSVIKARLDAGPTPILTQVLMPPLGAFASPERARGGGASPFDDVWALHATLYAMLTGNPPVRVDVGGRVAFEHLPMSGFGPPDELLDEILARGLSHSPKERTRSAEQLEADLVVWLSRNSQKRALTVPPPRAVMASETTDLGRDSIQDELRADGELAVTEPVAASSATPPPPPVRDPEPLPPSAAPPESEAFAEPADESPAASPCPPPLDADPQALTPAMPALPFASSPPEDAPTSTASTAANRPATDAAPSRRVLAGIVALAAALGGVVWFARTSGPAPRPEATSTGVAPGPRAATAVRPAAPQPEVAPPDPPIAPLASAAPAASAPGQTPAERTACVARYFPPATFVVPQDLAFVCQPGDARGHVKNLYTRLVAAGAGASTPGMREWATLDWYELAVFAIVRHGCCPDAPPIELPTEGTACEPIGPALDKLGEAVARHGEVELRILGFDKSAVCLHTQGGGPFKYTSHPYWGGQASFGGFMKRNLP